LALITIILTVALFIGLGISITIVFPPGIQIKDATPELKIISAPTSTGIGEDDSSEISLTPTIPVEVDGISAGIYVQVNRTGGTGLRLRSDPGSSGDTVSIATESEVFLVIGGPQSVDDVTWWRLEAPYQTGRNGWAAADYLSPISTQTPN